MWRTEIKINWLRALGVLAVLVASGSTLAQYPERPIHLIIPFPPGGGTDSIARLVAEKVSEKLGQPVVSENRVGASGVIASELVAKAPADGYTLLVATTNHSSNPALMKNLPYDSVNDFSAISLLAEAPGLLVANSSVKFNTFPEFIAYARKNADLNYASPGVGTFPHLGMAMLISRAGLKMAHVPYKGAGPAMIDLISGRVQVKVDTYITSAPYLKAGKLKLLAVTSSNRLNLLPDVPTVAEMGYPGFESTFWMGIVGPKNMPEAIRAQLEKTFNDVIKSDEVSKYLIAAGWEPKGDTGAVLAGQIKREIPEYQKIVKEFGITVD
jgi:tripartite-type tricarboxylate transporter receptor subunit TctC